MQLKFALDGVEIDNESKLASCDRIHAFSIINALLFQLACTDSTQEKVVVEQQEEVVDPSRGERLPPRP